MRGAASSQRAGGGVRRMPAIVESEPRAGRGPRLEEGAPRGNHSEVDDEAPHRGRGLLSCRGGVLGVAGGFHGCTLGSQVVMVFPGPLNTRLAI